MFYHEIRSFSPNPNIPKGTCNPYCWERYLLFGDCPADGFCDKRFEFPLGSDLDKISDTKDIGCELDTGYFNIDQFNNLRHRGFNIFHFNRIVSENFFDSIHD